MQGSGKRQQGIHQKILNGDNGMGTGFGNKCLRGVSRDPLADIRRRLLRLNLGVGYHGYRRMNK